MRFEDKQGAEELHLQAERDMSTVVEHGQTLAVGQDRDFVVGNDETSLVKHDRQTTVKAPEDEAGNETRGVHDRVRVEGTHDKTVMGRGTQSYADKHTRKVVGEQELLVEQNKHEHVGQAYTLKTDKKFQLAQGASSMTLRNHNSPRRRAATDVLPVWQRHLRLRLLGCQRLLQAALLDQPGGHAGDQRG